MKPRYSGPPRIRVSWPPTQTPREGKLRAGEPVLHPLIRYANNKAAEAVETSRCCGCGFEHVMVYRVFLSSGGRIKNRPNDWWLTVSAYPVENTRPKRPVKRAKP